MSVEAFNYLITAHTPTTPALYRGFRLCELAQSGVVWDEEDRVEALELLQGRVYEILATSDKSFSPEHPFGKPEDVGPLALYLLSCAERTTRTTEDGQEQAVWITGRGLEIYSPEHAGWIAALMLKIQQSRFPLELYRNRQRPDDIVAHNISLLEGKLSQESILPVYDLERMDGTYMSISLSYLTFLKHCANFPFL